MTTLRVSKAELPSELRESMIEQFGAVAEPVEVTWHNPAVAQAALEFGAKIATWDAADDSLKTFAHMAVAAQVGCSWCLDLNYFAAQTQGLDMAKASQVPRWRESELFTPLERDVLEYAEAMTDTPTTVTDELSASLLEQLGAVPEPVEVTYNNPKVAISSQEFSASVATWDAVDASLKTLAHMAVAAQVGCSWCLDVNY